jgi:hypothetical protein
MGAMVTPPRLPREPPAAQFGGGLAQRYSNGAYPSTTTAEPHPGRFTAAPQDEGVFIDDVTQIRYQLEFSN